MSLQPMILRAEPLADRFVRLEPFDAPLEDWPDVRDRLDARLAAF